MPALTAPAYGAPVDAVGRLLRIHGSMGEQRRPAAASRSSDLLSLGSFVLLGLPDGMLGTAWPSMRATFGAPVGDLGLILLIATAGSVLVTAFVGPLIRRLGVPAVLAAAVIGFVVLGGALAGVFPALIALTPVRLGEQRAHNVISWQVGAAAAGGAGLSAVIGLLIGATSLAVLGPAITVLALILLAAELVLNRLAPIAVPGISRAKPPLSPIDD